MFTYTSFWHCCACLPPFLLICLRHLDSFLGNTFPLSLSCCCLDDLLALFFFFDNYRVNILLFLCSLTSFETGFHNSVQIARNNLLETWHHSMCNLLVKDSTRKPKNKKRAFRQTNIMQAQIITLQNIFYPDNLLWMNAWMQFILLCRILSWDELIIAQL